MDEVSKFRLTGAVIWLGLLVVIVPIWYSNPVNFSPDSEQKVDSNHAQPLVYQAYLLPNKSKEGQEHPGQSPIANELKPQKIEQNTFNDESELSQKPLVDAVPYTNLKTPIREADKTVSQSLISKRPEVKPGQWLLMIYASNSIKDANKVLGRLDDKYDVWIKEFPSTNSYSVRIGPYQSRTQAEKDKRKIDRAINTQSKIVQVK